MSTATTKKLPLVPAGLQLVSLLPVVYIVLQYKDMKSEAGLDSIILTFGSVLFWFGLSVLIMSMTVSLTVKLFAGRNLTADEDRGSDIAGLCSLGLMGLAWGGYDGVEYGVLSSHQAMLIFLLAYVLFCLPILKQILYRVGLRWYLASVLFLVVIVALLQGRKDK